MKEKTCYFDFYGMFCMFGSYHGIRAVRFPDNKGTCYGDKGTVFTTKDGKEWTADEIWSQYFDPQIHEPRVF